MPPRPRPPGRSSRPLGGSTAWPRHPAESPRSPPTCRCSALAGRHCKHSGPPRRGRCVADPWCNSRSGLRMRPRPRSKSTESATYPAGKSPHPGGSQMPGDAAPIHSAVRYRRARWGSKGVPRQMLLMRELRSHSSEISGGWSARLVHPPEYVWLTCTSSFIASRISVGGRSGDRQRVVRKSPKRVGSLAQYLDRPAVNPPRRLRAGTFAVAEIPLRAVQVKDRTGGGGLAVRVDPIHREHLTLGVRLDPNRQAPGLSVPGEGGLGRSQLPSPVYRSSPAGGAKQRHQEKNG